jgi:hypothetical protein
MNEIWMTIRIVDSTATPHGVATHLAVVPMERADA